jgi:hypothetical protein
MEPLPPQMLPAVSHVVFSIFDLAIPNIIAWALVIVLLLISAWARLPGIFEPKPVVTEEVNHEPDQKGTTASDR